MRHISYFGYILQRVLAGMTNIYIMLPMPGTILSTSSELTHIIFVVMYEMGFHLVDEDTEV